jgi:hypothetical protein
VSGLALVGSRWAISGSRGPIWGSGPLKGPVLGPFEEVCFEGFHFGLILGLFLGGSWPEAPKGVKKGVKKGSKRPISGQNGLFWALFGGHIWGFVI